jgi:hypothetical protein
MVWAALVKVSMIRTGVVLKLPLLILGEIDMSDNIDFYDIVPSYIHFLRQVDSEARYNKTHHLYVIIYLNLPVISNY